MTDTLELELALKRAHLTKSEVAKRLGISNMAFFNKLNNRAEFKASEIALLMSMLPIDDINKVFFAAKGD